MKKYYKCLFNGLKYVFDCEYKYINKYNVWECINIKSDK